MKERQWSWSVYYFHKLRIESMSLFKLATLGYFGKHLLAFFQLQVHESCSYLRIFCFEILLRNFWTMFWSIQLFRKIGHNLGLTKSVRTTTYPFCPSLICLWKMNSFVQKRQKAWKFSTIFFFSENYIVPTLHCNTQIHSSNHRIDTPPFHHRKFSLHFLQSNTNFLELHHYVVFCFFFDTTRGFYNRYCAHVVLSARAHSRSSLNMLRVRTCSTHHANSCVRAQTFRSFFARHGCEFRRLRCHHFVFEKRRR